MPASSTSWLKPRSVKPSCTNGAEQTRSLLTQRRNLCTSCPTPSRMEILFKLLGICFDCKLRMDLAVRDVVSQASWKLSTILRTRRFHGVSQHVQVKKSQVLLLQCTTRPKQLWQESTRCRGAFSANAVSLTKRRSYISTSPDWSLDGTSLCWV